MSINELARPEIRVLAAYRSRELSSKWTRLNANEMPESPYAIAPQDAANRYPELRPATLTAALAGFYEVAQENVCPTRGSSEGIDLLVRTFCRAYRDNVLVMPPSFEMYTAYATMQAAEVLSVPLMTNKGYAVDWQALQDTCNENTRIAFLCCPNNPTGNLIPREDIIEFAQSRAGKTIVVVDEAYIEFSGQSSLADSVRRQENLVVLRTLSKAYALAGARCGAVVASESVIALISALMTPFALSTPATNLVLDALEQKNRSAANRQIEEVIQARERLVARLVTLDVVERVWPSSANFVLVRFANAEAVNETLHAHHIALRYFDGNPSLQSCARITVGTTAENERLVRTLQLVARNS